MFNLKLIKRLKHLRVTKYQTNSSFEERGEAFDECLKKSLFILVYVDFFS